MRSLGGLDIHRVRLLAQVGVELAQPRDLTAVALAFGRGGRRRGVRGGGPGPRLGEFFETGVAAALPQHRDGVGEVRDGRLRPRQFRAGSLLGVPGRVLVRLGGGVRRRPGRGRMSGGSAHHARMPVDQLGGQFRGHPGDAALTHVEQGGARVEVCVATGDDLVLEPVQLRGQVLQFGGGGEGVAGSREVGLEPGKGGGGLLGLARGLLRSVAATGEFVQFLGDPFGAHRQIAALLLQGGAVGLEQDQPLLLLEQAVEADHLRRPTLFVGPDQSAVGVGGGTVELRDEGPTLPVGGEGRGRVHRGGMGGGGGFGGAVRVPGDLDDRRRPPGRVEFGGQSLQLGGRGIQLGELGDRAGAAFLAPSQLGRLREGRPIADVVGARTVECRQREVPVLGGVVAQSMRPHDRFGVGARLEAGGRADLGEEQVDGTLLFLEAGGCGTAPVLEPAFDGAESGGVEQPLEQLAAVLAVGAQELRELALRQQHDLEELLGAHPEQPPDGLPDVGQPGEVLTRAVEPGQARFGVLLDGPGSAQLRTLVVGAAHDPQPPAGDGRLEAHLGCGAGGGVIGQQPAPVGAGPGHRAVQGERHRIEDEGLAGAGAAVQQEQSVGAEFVEVHPHGVGERAERGDLQLVQPHADASPGATVCSVPTPAARSTSRSACCTQRSSRADGSERTSVRNSRAMSRSVRPRTFCR